MNVSVVIPSAGMSRRLPALVEKPYLRLGAKPILAWTIEHVSKCVQVAEIILVVSENNLEMCRKEVVDKYQFPKVKHIVAGGETRGESVYNGLNKVSSQTDIVLIHDGVRPFVTLDIIEDSIKTAAESGAVICAVPVISTIKRVREDLSVAETVDRQHLVTVQTPQAFKKELILKAYSLAKEKGFQATDDAAVVEWSGHPVKVIMGSYKNIKITTPDDLVLARAILDEIK